jgi:hypothetical protein
MTERDRPREGLADSRAIARDVPTMVLLRWIAVAIGSLAIAMLASGDETRASDVGVDACGARRDARSVRRGEEGSR